jgi:hypothetical protein
MDSFIHRENLALYKKRLAETTDEATRNIILKLLAEEETKDGIHRNSQGSAPAGRPPNDP